MAGSVYEYPRVTRSIRSFSDLDRPNYLKRVKNTLEKRMKWKANQAKSGTSWSDVCRFMEGKVGGKSAVMKELRNLRSVAVEICGSDQTEEVVDDAAFFLLRLFMDQEHVMQKHMNLLKQTFGSISPNLAGKVHKCVCSIANSIPEECKDYIRNGQSNVNIHATPFGDHVAVNPMQRVPYECDTKFLHDWSAELGSEVIKEFTMKYDENMAWGQAKEETKKNQSKKNGYGRSWLEKELRKHPSGITVEQLAENIIEMLKSGRSSDELQNELFDLLGFDQFELIQSLLEHRTDVVSISSAEEKRLTNSTLLDQRRPNFGCQVTVQSEQEKLLLKQAIKEEKKIQKICSRLEDDSDEEPVVEIRPPKKDTSVRPKAGPAAVRDKVRPAQIRESYPHVYDSQQQAQQKSGFIVGQKMLLPEGVQRTDTKTYEEVNIPVSPPPPLNVGNKLIEISSLDKDLRRMSCGSEDGKGESKSKMGPFGRVQEANRIARMNDARKMNGTPVDDSEDWDLFGLQVAKRLRQLHSVHAAKEVQRIICATLSEAEEGKYDKSWKDALSTALFENPNPPPYSMYAASKTGLTPKRVV